MQEGTRNERVVILIASYLIGFITAYIAFGVVQLEDSVKFVYVPVTNTASVIESQPTAVTATETSIQITQEGLVVTEDGVETLLSARAQSDLSEPVEGLYTELAHFSLAPAKDFVYFCEIPVASAVSCKPFVYSIADKIVYPVTLNGDRVAFDSEKAIVEWTADGQLLIDEHFSPTATRPWEL